jgi:hypothetical protein
VAVANDNSMEEDEEDVGAGIRTPEEDPAELPSPATVGALGGRSDGMDPKVGSIHKSVAANTIYFIINDPSLYVKKKLILILKALYAPHNNDNSRCFHQKKQMRVFT